MLKSTKSRWKFSFHRSPSSFTSSPSPNSTSAAETTELPLPSPPPSFVCSISSSLMSDPVILPSGHTFDRRCVEACLHFNFNPVTNSLSDSPLNLNLIPNIALKSAITDWCDRFSVPHPSPLSPESARSLVGSLIMSQKSVEKVERLRLSPSSSSSSYPSSSSVSSISSSSDSSVVVDNDSKKLNPDTESVLEEEIFAKLKSPQISKESGLVSLKQYARESAHLRLSLCTERILKAVVPLISFPNSPTIQANATAVIINLSMEQINKVRIVRSGALPSIIDALNSNYSVEVQSNAAGALFSLALDDNNKLVIGVLGAIPLLVALFCSDTNCYSARVEAGMALYHLSLAPNNISKTVKSAKAVKQILNVATYYNEEKKDHDDDRVHKVAMMVLANLVKKNEGRAALMDAGAVKAMVNRLKMNLDVDYCLDLLYEMSKGSRMRFRVLANAAGAEKALMENRNVEVEVLRRMLKIVRGGCEEIGMMSLLGLRNEVEQEDEVGSVVSDGLLSFRRRQHDYFGSDSGPNSANF